MPSSVTLPGGVASWATSVAVATLASTLFLGAGALSLDFFVSAGASPPFFGTTKRPPPLIVKFSSDGVFSSKARSAAEPSSVKGRPATEGSASSLRARGYFPAPSSVTRSLPKSSPSRFTDKLLIVETGSMEPGIYSAKSSPGLLQRCTATG